MSGEWIDNAPNGCSRKRTLTFARVAEADVSLLPDPAILPPRSVSPAEALHGGYDFVLTNVGRNPAPALHLISRTDCLRAGNRCLSALMSPETGGIRGLVFEDGSWASTQEYDTTCPKGGNVHAKLTSTLPLPQPLQDPIRLLGGHGYSDYTPSTKCPSGPIDETYTRTGD
jgi:serine/threonine-protein kinase